MTVSLQYFVSNFLTKTEALTSVVPNRGVKEVALEFIMGPYFVDGCSTKVNRVEGGGTQNEGGRRKEEG